MKRLSWVLIALNFMSCSSYVQRWHSQLDSTNNRSAQASQGNGRNDKFNLYRKNLPINKRLDSRGQQPSTSLYTPNIEQSVAPGIKRNYRPARQRPKVSDLYDRQNEGSLWSGVGQENYLFSRNNSKKTGDIIVIEVQQNLKKEISLELAKAFPDLIKKGSKGSEDQNKKEEEKDEGDEDKVFDRVSGVVVEEVNKNHLLIRGRKDVLYKKKKRLVEVQTLVTRNDISDRDTVQSSRVLESNVTVLR